MFSSRHNPNDNFSRRISLVAQSIPYAIALFLTTNLTTTAQTLPIDVQVKEVVAHLVGVMSTSTQAKINPRAANVRMTACIIQVDSSSTNSVYLYQEQAFSKHLDRPYRQRFLEISPSKDGTQVESKSFKPLHSEKWINLCDRPEKKTLVPMSELGESFCSVFLKPLRTIYLGETQSGGCPTQARGAVTITNTIILHTFGMDTWDKGFDAQGKQIWGAKTNSYQFRWLDR